MPSLAALLESLKMHTTGEWSMANVQSEARVFEFGVPDESLLRDLFERLHSLSLNIQVGAAVVATTLLPDITLLWQPVLGVYATAAALSVLLTLGIKIPKARKLAIAASILPIAAMVNLSLPEIRNTLARISVQYAVLLLLGASYVYIFREDNPLRKIRTCLGCYLNVLPIMVVIGEVLGAVSYAVLRHRYPYKGTPLHYVAAATVIFAIAEELVFRGLIQRQAAKLMHPVAAGVLAVITYVAATIGTGSVLPALFALMSGITLSAIYYFIPNLVLTTFTNITMKLTYLGLIATFIIR